jgi:hypothetical protein
LAAALPRRPSAALEEPRHTVITLRAVTVGPKPFWRRRRRIRFYHQLPSTVSVRAANCGILEVKSAGAATRPARPESIRGAYFYVEQAGMTLAGDPANGHGRTCGNKFPGKVSPPMCFWHRRRPASRPLRAQRVSKCCATPCTSDSLSRGAHHPRNAGTRAMQLCGPAMGHSGHFMLQQHAFGPVPMRARTPS